MNREFIYFRTFDKAWHNMGLTEDDLIDLENIIINNPHAGDVVTGTGGLRKLRFALPDKGKSGSSRILYVDFASHEITLMLNIYAKNKQKNITELQKHEFKKLIDISLKMLKGDL